MQFILPIIVGLMAAAMVISSGSVIGGLIFGPVMAAMVWGAFFWRPRQTAEQQEVPSSAQATGSAESDRNASNMSSLSPHQVGIVLAMSLEVSCGTKNTSKQVREFAQSAGVSIERYHEEMLLLAAFAQDYSISTMLSGDHRQVEVLDGYRQVWADVGSKNSQGAALYEKFLERCPEYAKAMSNAEPGTVSPIALAFGGFLGESDAGAQLVALSLADGIFRSHIEGTALTLRKANLLPTK